MDARPFKAKVGGAPCVVAVEKDSLELIFGNGPRFVLPRRYIRCVQHSGKRLLINAQRDDTLVYYEIFSKSARSIFSLLTA